jgi:protein dithiol oxidoreductase (disulfide-forming)
MRAPAYFIVRCAICCFVFISIALPAIAQEARRDVDYREIPQQPVATGDRIEVIDFFFYGCQYCNDLLPRLERWRQQKPADVVFRRMPVVRHDSWVPLAKTFFTLEAMGELERLHAAVYHSYHVEDLYMSQEKVISEWAAKHGLDRDKFMAIYRSDETRQKVEQARKYTMDYDIQGTPSLVVDGRYLTDGSSAKTIAILDSLIKLARQQREKAGK